jgi:hypothetical protein
MNNKIIKKRKDKFEKDLKEVRRAIQAGNS